jgi:hypothetical protein
MIRETLKYYINRLIRFAIDIFVIIIGLIYPSHKNYLPPITERLLLEPAVNLVKQIKSGKVNIYISIV